MITNIVKRKKPLKYRISWGWVFTYTIMIILLAFMALPLLYMVVTAFKPLDELLLYPPTFFVKKPTLKNFSALFTTLDTQVVPFTRYAFNSIITTVTAVFGTVVVCSMGAYSVEKIKIPGQKWIFRLVIWGLMFSPPAAQIPIYIVMSKAGMLNTYWALIIPAIATPMYFFLMKQFISQIPDSLLESARIDGASEFTIFRKVIMPITKPAWSTVVVFSFIANWNNSSGSVIYITNQTMKTLPYALSTVGDGSISRMGAMAAATLLITLPTIIVYLVMQAKVMQTMAYAGIKG